jgi:lipid-A-disaccharide synthase
MVKIAMVAGEASSDQLAARLMRSIRQQIPDVQFIGIGGAKMQKEGLDAWWSADELSVRGIVEVLRRYRRIAGIRSQLLKRLIQEKPDVFVGVDGYDFNMWIESRLKRKGIPTIHYVSPSIWAWRRNRIKTIAKSTSHVLALYPFEPELYEGTQTRCAYVGHPLADEIQVGISQQKVREQLEIAADIPVVALLPGSRPAELEFMAEAFIQAAILLHKKFPEIRFLVPLISRETRQQFEATLWRLGARELPIHLMFGHAQEAVAASDVVLLASGTATLETALIGRPMVVAYKMSTWTWRIMKRMRYTPWVALPNVLSRAFVVPEFLQDDANPENLSQALANLLADKKSQVRIRNSFSALHSTLRQGAADRAAEVVMPYLSKT